MIVKCMSDEDAADDDSRKTYRIVAGVKTVEFVCGNGAGPIAVIYMENGDYREEHLRGNCYVMNDAGKTISSFGVAALPPGGGQMPALG